MPDLSSNYRHASDAIIKGLTLTRRKNEPTKTASGDDDSVAKNESLSLAPVFRERNYRSLREKIRRIEIRLAGILILPRRRPLNLRANRFSRVPRILIRVSKIPREERIEREEQGSVFIRLGLKDRSFRVRARRVFSLTRKHSASECEGRSVAGKPRFSFAIQTVISRHCSIFQVLFGNYVSRRCHAVIACVTKLPNVQTCRRARRARKRLLVRKIRAGTRICDTRIIASQGRPLIARNPENTSFFRTRRNHV